MTETKNPYERLDTASDSPEQTKRLRSKVIIWLIPLAIVLIVVALLQPAIRNVSPARGPSQCKFNLRQIAFALHSYAAKYDAFPPAYTVDSSDKPLHSWRTLILPYLDHPDLYGRIDLSKPWNDPANAEASRIEVPIFCCPDAVRPPNFTTYLAVIAPNGCPRPTEPRKISEITDGLGETLMVIDAASAQAVPWMSTQDANEEFVLALGSRIEMAHPNGTNVAFVDGSVGFLDANTSAAERRALISIAENDETGSTAGR